MASTVESSSPTTCAATKSSGLEQDGDTERPLTMASTVEETSTTSPSTCTPATTTKTPTVEPVTTSTSTSPSTTSTASPITSTSTDNRMEQVGDKERGMVLVYPPPDHPAVSILRQINKELNNPKIKRRFWNWNHQDQQSEIESCRMIQGGRLEIFLMAKDKSSQAFDTILGPLLRKGAKEMVLEYARQQANQDPRLQDTQYQYENFSLLVSLGKRPAQAPHLDLVHPNFQFGVVLSDKSQGTLFVENQDALGRVATVEDLAHLWNQNPYFYDDQFPDGVPPNIVTALEENEGAKLLLRYFGDTLIPEQALVENFTSRNGLPVGTLASLPGSVVHAGPSSDTVRTILFFSGTPVDTSSVDPYLPDSQYNGVTLMGHLVSILWRRDTIDTPERNYLLRRLVQYIEGTSAKEVWALFGEGELKEFVKSILKDTYNKSKQSFIRDKALCLEMTMGYDPFSTPDTEINVSDLTLISTENLFTMWEDREMPVLVYRRDSDGKVILRYRTKGADDDYEGHKANEKLTLTMNEDLINDRALFDGSNGKVTTAEDEVIEIYRGSRVNAPKAPMAKKDGQRKRKRAKSEGGRVDKHGDNDLIARREMCNLETIEEKVEALLEIEKECPRTCELTGAARKWASTTLRAALRCLRNHHGGDVQKFAEAFHISGVKWNQHEYTREICNGHGDGDECPLHNAATEVHL